MSERERGWHAALSSARLYSLVQRALGAENARRRLLADHVHPRAGERVLDLGCGPADILALMPGVSYTGIDSSPRYVAEARRRYGERADVRVGDVTHRWHAEQESFDVAIAVGLLHHLDAIGAGAAIGAAAAALVPGGRLVTLDPVLHDGQPRAARWLIERDRGRAVRGAGGYEELARPWFQRVNATVRGDLVRVPYTHAVLECTDPRR